MTQVLINAPKTAKKGEVIELKALILHPMETGFRPGTNGRIIPRNIIERFTASWNGAEIFRVHEVGAVRDALIVAEAVLGRSDWGVDERFAGEPAEAAGG